MSSNHPPVSCAQQCVQQLVACLMMMVSLVVQNVDIYTARLLEGAPMSSLAKALDYGTSKMLKVACTVMLCGVG